MQTVFTRQLAALPIGPHPDSLLYTAPATGTVVIRDVLFGTTGVGASTNIYMRDPGLLEYCLFRFKADDSVPYHQDLRQHLPPGWELRAVSAADNWTVVITGYVFPT